MNKPSDKQPFSKKNHYEFSIDKGRSIIIDSEFDNGNIRLIKQQNQLNYRLQAVADFELQGGRKSWFFFKVVCSKDIRVRLVIQNVGIFEHMYQDKNWCRPVLRQGNQSQWHTVKDCFLTMRNQVQLVIDHTFLASDLEVYFALSVPFTFADSQQYLSDLKYRATDNIRYNDEVIGKSNQGRPIHLLTIEDRLCSNSKDRLVQTVNGYKKPIILITARVHPGEVSSMYCLQGIIQFLLKPCNLQALILRKLFRILIVPTVNPDGVYEGNYRMDINGVNLNRVYSDPDQQKHPTVFSIRNLVQQITKQYTIQYHFDLHSHSCYKPAFIYGNAHEDIVDQTECELYCQILDKYSSTFKYSLCQFGARHMKSKDKGESMTKEGCARVVFSKLGNIINSYTVQTSIFTYPKEESFEKQTTFLPVNPQFQLGEYLYHYISYYYERLEKSHESNSVIRENVELGFCLMVAILDHVDKNPYKIMGTHIKNQFRRQIATQLLQNQERFKMLDIKAYHKAKFIHKFAKEEFANRQSKQWAWLGLDQTLSEAKWPEGFIWFSSITLQNKVQGRKKQKMKTEISDNNLRDSCDILAGEKGLTKRRCRYFSPIAPQNMQIQCLPEIDRTIPPQTGDKSIRDGPNNNVRDSLRNKIKGSSRAQEKIDKKESSLKNILQESENLKAIQLNPLITMKQLKLGQVKNNVIMEFITKEINKMNEKKVKKELPARNRLINYKAAMRDKSLKHRSSDSNHIAIQSAKKLLQWGDAQRQIRDAGESDFHSQNKVHLTEEENLRAQPQCGELRNYKCGKSTLLFPIQSNIEKDLLQKQTFNLRSRFLTINDEQLQVSMDRKNKQSILGNRRQIVKSQVNEFKKRNSNKGRVPQSQKVQNKPIRLPDIAKSKICIDTTSNKFKYHFKTEQIVAKRSLDERGLDQI